MSKPREFWVWDSVDGTRKVTDYDPKFQPVYHVIEKSAADKLAEALEKIIAVSHAVQSMAIAEKALAEYRGESGE